MMMSIFSSSSIMMKRPVQQLVNMSQKTPNSFSVIGKNPFIAITYHRLLCGFLSSMGD